MVVTNFSAGIVRTVLCAVSLAVGAVPAAAAEPPPLMPRGELLPLREAADLQWRRDAADEALVSGFPAIAVRLYQSLLEQVDIAGSARDEIALDLVTAAIQDGDDATVAATLDRFSASSGPRWNLRRAMMAYQRGELRAADRLLRRIDGDVLPPDDLAWLSLVLGLVREAEGQMRSAQLHFDTARERATTDALRSSFELIARRHRLLAGRADESMVADLRRSLRAMEGQRGGFESARLLVIALYRLDRPGDAIEVIDDQLRLMGVDERDLRQQFLLLMALIAGEDTGRGRLALQEILRRPSDREVQRMALQLLARDPLRGEGRAEFLSFLGQVIETDEAAAQVHPLLDAVLMLRARLRLDAGDLDAAEDDSLRLLDQFPGSPMTRDATRLLAYISWSRRPPQYRTAANYLNNLRTELPDGPERARLGVLMGDCYFLNGDFDDASGAYGTALEHAPEAERGAILFQRVLAEIRAGRHELAQRILDEAEAITRADPLSRWRAEWNLIRSMKERGEIEQAFARIRYLLAEEGVAVLPSALRVRLYWLDAQLALEAGRPEGTSERVATILRILDDVGPEEMDVEQRRQIRARSLLLRGEAYFHQENPETGLDVFGVLRERYADTTAAALSFLIEARYHAAHGRLVDAQQRLMALTELPGDLSDYAPIALWEAAQLAERRGLNASYQEAIAILERLVIEYSDHSLAYYARLKQADLSRMLNDFAAAQLIYEGLLSRYPDHPEHYRTELSRADVFLAESGHLEARLEDAVAIYERLFDLSQLPRDLRAEAGYKWGFALFQTGAQERARDVYWMVVQRLLRNTEHTPGETSPQGAYWLARAIFELGTLLEEEHRYDEAHRLFELVLQYGLPGRNLAQARLARFHESRSQ